MLFIQIMKQILVLIRNVASPYLEPQGLIYRQILMHLSAISGRFDKNGDRSMRKTCDKTKIKN